MQSVLSQELLEIKGNLNKALIYDRINTRVFLIGSSMSSKGRLFDSRLSDLDLLVVPTCSSFDDYVGQLDQAITISRHLNRPNGQLVDVFMLTACTAELHFSCLSVLAGGDKIPDKDIIFGLVRENDICENPLLGYSFRKKVYQAKALSMVQECQRLLPVADTTKARKTAKFLRKTLKAFICANTSAGTLRSVEEKLFSMSNFSSLRTLINERTEVEIPLDTIFQKVLDGNAVEDWPAWMKAQEQLASWFVDIEPDITRLDTVNGRLYGGISEVSDMLMLDLKNIFSEEDDVTRTNMIGEYADSTASVMVKLALSGIATLLDFTTPTTPSHVRQGYDILVDHLKLSRPDVRCLAASVILLEYALEQAAHYDID